MTTTLALLLDSYRELNAKRLFWVVLALSGLVVAFFGAVGLRGDSVTLLGWQTPLQFELLSMVSPATFYKFLFVTFGIQVWLSWLATVLALASTAGIFPDLLADGSIDLYLSRPLSRLRLFVTKYVGGFLFVTLQVSVFCAASFVVLGLRGGTWEPAVFLAVPLVVLMFSYLYAACVLLGVWTRSTLVALLLALLFWCALWAVQQTESGLLRARVGDQLHALWLDREIIRLEGELQVAPASRPAQGRSFLQMLFATPDRVRIATDLHDRRAERARGRDRFALAHRIAYAVAWPLPKTGQTIDLLERQVEDRAELPHARDDDEDPRANFRNGRRGEPRVDAEVRRQLQARPAAWVIGTSCAFEAVIVTAAAWLFCRRDY